MPVITSTELHLITGVFSNDTIDMWDEVHNGDAIDPDADDFEREDYADWQELNPNEPMENYEPNWDDYEQTIALIGYRFDPKTQKYEPNPDAEFSAIVRLDSNVTQVTLSKYCIQCSLCSPCYPNQGNADSEGTHFAYSVPPAHIYDDIDEPKTEVEKELKAKSTQMKERIKLIDEINTITPS